MQQPRQIETVQQSEALITLADTLQLPVDSVVGQQLLAVGLPGSGKTNAVALLCEQLGQYYVPMAVFDKEGDFLSMVSVLPRGMIATAGNCPSGRDILDKGLQVVFDLSTWDSLASAGEMIATIVNQMMAWSSMRPSYERVPALLVLDEAHTWLPEKRGATIPKETFAKLFDTFQAVGSTGRKRGLTPFYACPKISELSKSILYPGMYLFFKTSLHSDLQRVLEYVSSDTLTAKGLRQYISSLPKGKAIVKLPNGRQKTILFHKRASEHVSHTPGVLSALNKYAAMPFDANGSYGMDMPEAEQVPEQVAPKLMHAHQETSLIAATPDSEQSSGQKTPEPEPVRPVSGMKICEIMLKKNPLLTAEELAKMAGIELPTAEVYRRQILAPTRNSAGAIRARVLAVLQVDADISDTDLAKHANCTLDQARQHRSALGRT